MDQILEKLFLANIKGTFYKKNFYSALSEYTQNNLPQ